MLNVAAPVLCVEDDLDTREMLKVVLQGHGYDFKAVDNCADALRLIRANNISAVLLDNLLPDGSGIELCRQVREFNQSLPIIFLSGSAYDNERDDALGVGANAFLTKPFELEELFLVLARYVPANVR
jgi:DNA-binding response OmpR family regulator